MPELTTIVSFIFALSVASERLVEIVKGFFPELDEKKDNIDEEAWRRARLHLLAIGAGIVTAGLAWASDILPSGAMTEGMFSDVVSIFGFGLLAGGGSGFWNSVLDYFNGIKDIKNAEAKQKRVEVNENVTE